VSEIRYTIATRDEARCPKPFNLGQSFDGLTFRRIRE